MMLRLSVDTKRVNNWMNFGRTLSATCVLESENPSLIHSDVPVSELARSFLFRRPIVNNLFEKVVFGVSSSELAKLSNLSGRYLVASCESFRADLKNDKDGEELLFLRGAITHAPLSYGDEIPEEAMDRELTQKVMKTEETTSFELGVYSHFQRFRGSRAIEYIVTEQHSDILDIVAPNSSLRELLDSEKVSIESFRIGFEQYKAKVALSMFGAVPMLEKRIYVDVGCRKISVFWEREFPLGTFKMSFEGCDWLNSLNYGLGDTVVHRSFVADIIKSHGIE